MVCLLPSFALGDSLQLSKLEGLNWNTSMFFFYVSLCKERRKLHVVMAGRCPEGKKKFILVNIELFAQNLNFYITLS